MKKGALQVLIFVLLFAYCLAALGPSPPVRLEPPPPPPPPSPYSESYFSVSVNGYETQDISLILEDKNKQLWISGKDLKKWNINLPSIKPMMYQEEAYYPVSSIPGLSFSKNIETMALNLQAPVDVFAETVIDAQGSQTYDYTLPSPGGFLNYNFFGTTVAEGSNQYTLLYTLGIFNQYGVGIANFMSSTSKEIGYVLRLTTTWTYDKPSVMQTWNFGDTTSTPTGWSGSNNYGGIQWQTNFATQPYFLTFPLRTMHGQATIPSTVDLFVNGAMAMNKQVPPGRFTVNNVPLIDGLGNITMMTRDVQGREQTVVVPYYSSTSILKKGLRNFSYELGILRLNLGVNSNDYARVLAAVTESYGVSDTFTVQFHGEALPTQQAAGINLAKVIYPLGVFNVTGAGSRSNTGNGLLGGFGYQFQSQKFSFGFNTQLATNHFTQQAIPQGQFQPKVMTQVFSGFNVGSVGSMSITYTRLVAHLVPNISLLTASFSGTIFKEIGYSLTWINSLGGIRNNTFIANLTYSFGIDDSGSNTTASFNRTDANNALTHTASVVRSLPQGPGYGYNITATRGGRGTTATSNTNVVGLSLQNNIGTLIGQVNAAQHEKYIYSLNVSGAVVRLSQQLFLTRTVTGAFGVVELPGFSNVDVYANNLLIGRTNERGNVLVPTLLPYDKTTIKIDTNKLPFDAEIGETSKIVAPYNFSGVVIPFDVKKVQNVSLIAKLAAGGYPPLGATVTVEGVTDPFIVGMNGEVFLSNVPKQSNVTVTWPGGSCKMSVVAPDSAGKLSIPELGEVLCR